jgi:hypothetical protein
MLDEIMAQTAVSSPVVDDEVVGNENFFNYSTFISCQKNHHTPKKVVTYEELSLEVVAHAPGAPFKVRRRKPIQDQRTRKIVKKLFS